jgi:hypothetical protein
MHGTVDTNTRWRSIEDDSTSALASSEATHMNDPLSSTLYYHEQSVIWDDDGCGKP